MKFAHIADVHMGGWRDPRMKDLSFKYFDEAINICIQERVDFLLIAGDLFNTSYPGIDALKKVAEGLRSLRDKNIRVYAIAGSHDYSPSGKAMIDVLQNAGLLINVAKGQNNNGELKLEFSEDISGVKIVGIPGRANMLDKKYYEQLHRPELENTEGYKIFLFHTALEELKPKNMEKMEAQPVSLLPRNFDYYAGGHVHIVANKEIDGYRNIVYPGPLFPNSFSELEHLKKGGMFIVDATVDVVDANNVESSPGIAKTNTMTLAMTNAKTTARRIEIEIKKIITIKKFFEIASAEDIKNALSDEIKKHDFNDAVVLIRVHALLKTGRISDIRFQEIIEEIYSKGAYFVMKNCKIESQEYQSIKVEAQTPEQIEEKFISENPEPEKVRKFITLLNQVKQEGETNSDFDERISEEIIEETY